MKPFLTKSVTSASMSLNVVTFSRGTGLASCIHLDNFSGQYFITRNNTTSTLCNMSGYCDASNNMSPAKYCLNQTGGCAWSDASNICVDLDSITGGLSGYTTNPFNITSTYTYTEFVNDGKCISDQNDSSGNSNYCDITNDASLCKIATWNTNENYGTVWNGNCKLPNNFCTDSSYDTIYCPKYIGSSPCLLYTSPSPRDRQK